MNSKFALNYLKTLRNQLAFSTSAVALTTLIQQSYCAANKQYYFNYGSHMIPHPEKAHKGGEDALFVDKDLVAVADGVGGWAELGVDPGLYSKELCKRLEEAFKRERNTKEPKQLIISAAKATKAIGSSTVCVLSMDQSILKASFVGDSGYAIFRKQNGQYELIFKSKEQQKSFNFPYQIGSEGDPPTCAAEEQHNVQVGDLIVLGTDGLFDNMSARQVKIVIDDVLKGVGEVDSNQLAKSIANYAYRLSLDQNYDSPFAQNARQNRLFYKGGKSDDITVVVAEIKE